MNNYLLYLVVSCFLVLLPGPDMALATRNTIATGRTAGLCTIFGTSTALLIHTTAAALGLSTLLLHSAVLFSAFKYIGALYLAYLGIRTLLSLRKHPEDHAMAQKPLRQKVVSKHISYFQGFFTNLTNPKVAVFFLTFLPQFIRTDNQSIIPFFILGISQIAINLFLLSMYVLLVESVTYWMQRPNVQRVIQGVTGCILIGFSVQLVLLKHR
ncbi:LysE family translocator [Sporolactobacillus nakayamae]|uniref:Threonine/homoserine/homoserine lactone efflux protein n=1 Tax=Sporolactobacillus nakayamae TaxID=269670 RepID=A0A1I2QRH5_9BACL|nr:LysE family translocator [Sporolactobacillus nakayamae]SFG28877.1 Threonine/homoserine/homoserine lactone efflux protein [Sporolactobacillus nakayamae]